MSNFHEGTVAEPPYIHIIDRAPDQTTIEFERHVQEVLPKVQVFLRNVQETKHSLYKDETNGRYLWLMDVLKVGGGRRELDAEKLQAVRDSMITFLGTKGRLGAMLKQLEVKNPTADCE